LGSGAAKGSLERDCTGIKLGVGMRKGTSQPIKSIPLGSWYKIVCTTVPKQFEYMNVQNLFFGLMRDRVI
jgi:hypothetical protein